MRHQLLRLVSAVALSLSFIALTSATPTLAEERTCRGTIGARTVDNLRVPDGATCRLNGTKVKGTIKVETNAVLLAQNVRVIGNVQAEDARKVVVTNSRIGGNIQVVQSGIAKVRYNRISGGILFDENTGLNIASRNVVDEDVQAFQNKGGVRIFDNRIDGNLQCKANRPKPVGDGNVVQGSKQDQCKRL